MCDIFSTWENIKMEKEQKQHKNRSNYITRNILTNLYDNSYYIE